MVTKIFHNHKESTDEVRSQPLYLFTPSALEYRLGVPMKKFMTTLKKLFKWKSIKLKTERDRENALLFRSINDHTYFFYCYSLSFYLF